MHVRRTPTGRGTTGRPASGRSTTARGASSRSRRLLTGALVVTGLVAALGVSGAAGLEPVRGAAATVLGPLERLLGPGDDEASAARAEAAALSTRLAAAQREVAALHGSAGILETPALAGARLVPARVVAVGAPGPAGPERVTIDAGSRDGVEVDRTVVAARGLVGRVVSVAPWTSDVLLLGSPDLTVGVRVGPRGVLGEASGAALAGGARPGPGLLSFALVDRGAATAGDVVTTLGSVGDRPFVPGIAVGHGEHRAHRRRPAGPHRHRHPGGRHHLARRRRGGAHAGAHRTPPGRDGHRMTARVASLLRGLAVLGAVLLVVTLGVRHVPVVPDLVLVLVVAWALLRGPVVGAGVGLAAGWLLDLVPPGSAHLGVQALTYAVAGAFAGRLRVEGPVAAPRVALVALGASAVVEGVGVLSALAVGAPVDLGGVAVQCVLTATVAALVVPLVVAAERGLARRRFG